MHRITYRATFSGELTSPPSASSIGTTNREQCEELLTVSARSINAGFPKALRRALEPLGNGRRRELTALELWEVA